MNPLVCKKMYTTFCCQPIPCLLFDIAIWGQFHQRSKRSFYVCKLRVQLFCAYVLGLYFTGVSLPAQKLRIECWWNWAMVTCIVDIKIFDINILPSFLASLATHCTRHTTPSFFPSLKSRFFYAFLPLCSNYIKRPFTCTYTDWTEAESIFQ